MRIEKSNKSRFWAVVVVVSWLLIFSLAKDLRKVRSGFERIDESVNRLKLEEEKNRELKEKMRQVDSDYFKEKIMRDKLNLQKNGEIVVVLDNDLITHDSGLVAEKNGEEKQENWQKWWFLIK